MSLLSAAGDSIQLIWSTAFSPIVILTGDTVAEDFEAAVTYAVNLGGDADTIGAMTGAIAGAYHGARAIPRRWKDQVENLGKGRDYIQSLATQLFDLWKSRQKGGE
ncbi:MAG: ADP-ribosylglycohydrolase family protein [Clostridia bacterium]|nr:ADP-ribosylglycohydrolase family protein [Clostridia bacterium]